MTDQPTILEINPAQIPSSYRHDRCDTISAAIRILLRECAETDVIPFGNERAREQAVARIAQINDLLDQFLPI